MLQIFEIFESILGESTYSGLPFVIVRLSKCNLRCNYCDTEYSYNDGKDYTLYEVINKIESFQGIYNVLITGGEPLLQDESKDFIKLLIDKHYTVLIETNGSISIKDVDKRAIIIMDIKCPDSGMSDKNFLENFKNLKKEDEIKFVVSSLKDYEWAKEIIKKNKLIERSKVIISPAYKKIDPKILADAIVFDRLNVRLQIQLHKYIDIR